MPSDSSEPLTWVSFRDVSWLQAFPLTEESIFAYLALSQFYDRTCNNEVVYMQTRYTNQTGAPLPQTVLRERLQNMVGIEYILKEAKPPGYFLIQKVYRSSPTNFSLLAETFVVNGTIYQSPSLESILHFRLGSIVDNLGKAWNYCNKFALPDIATNSIKTRPDDANEEPVHPKDAAGVQEMIAINSTFLSLITKQSQPNPVPQ
jgi:mediator of RNA polymerase II transcription subunit 6